MLQTPLAEILVDHGKLTSEQKDTYYQEAADAGMSFVEYITRNSLVSEKALAQAYAVKFDARFFEAITDKMADSDLLGRIPLHFLREHTIMPVVAEGNCYIVATNPYRYTPIDELRTLLDGSCQVAVAPESVIREAINRYYPLGGTQEMIAELEEESTFDEGMDFGEIQEDDILGMASEAPVIKLVNHILYQAVKRNASDVHIEPFEKELRVRYRIDGVLHDTMTPPKRVQAALASRVKIMANLNIAEKRKPQDGRIQVKIADKPIDIRVSTLPVSHGERIVMRILDKTKTFAALTSLHLNDRDYEVLSHGIHKPNGIILVTGPTGSGKTSTLYSVLYELNTSSVNIVTVEDPVEYQMKGVGQVQVHEKVGLTFASALRSILRQDPDIVMIGETRDQETAQIAIQASLTGHLVLSTLHTNSAPASITRLVDMGIEPFLIASSVSVVVAQRLVRRLCDVCKKPYTPDESILKQFNIDKEDARGFYTAVGCDECMRTGYKGRLAVFEVMDMTSRMSGLTVEGASTADLREQAINDGMSTLLQDGLRKSRQGLTTLEEVLSVAAA